MARSGSWHLSLVYRPAWITREIAYTFAGKREENDGLLYPPAVLYRNRPSFMFGL